MALADGHDAGLHRRQPEREGAGIVLHQHAEKALHRAEESAVDHHRLMALAVFAHILHLKARRHVEVELHRRQLP